MAKKQKSGGKSKAAASSGGGKVANDANKMGSQSPTQKNEGKRTPESRSDRESQVGGDNQTKGRKGGVGAPSGGKSR